MLLAALSSLILAQNVLSFHYNGPQRLLVPSTPSETLVNTYKTGSQENPTVAVLTDGKVIIAWQSASQDGSAFPGVYAQMYNADGSVKGVEFIVNTVTANTQAIPAVGALTDGGFVIAWQSNAATQENNYGIYAQIYNGDGTLRGINFRANTYIAGDQEMPAVTGLADGGFLIVWQSEQISGKLTEIYGQRYNADGTTRGVEFQVNTFINNAQEEPAVTNLANGGFIVAWMSNNQQGNNYVYDIYFQRYDANGNRVGGETRANTYWTYSQAHPSIAELADGKFVIVWDSALQDPVASSSSGTTGVYGQMYNADGSPFGTEFRVNTYLANAQEYPSVASFSDGSYIVVWQSNLQDGKGYGVYGQLFNIDGAPSGSEFIVNTIAENSQQYPVGAVLQNGYIIVWQDSGFDKSGQAVVARWFTCPTITPILYSNDCYATCPAAAPIKYKNACYTVCPSAVPFMYNQECLTECPIQVPYGYNHSCVTTCPAEAPYTYNLLCYSTCPNEAPTPINGQCHAGCPVVTPYLYNQSCYTSCPAEAPYLYSLICYSSCPSAAPILHNSSCYATCPAEVPLTDGTGCFTACTVATPLVFNQTCYAACPTQAPNLYNQQCYAACPAEASHLYNHTCYDTCPTEAPYFTNTTCYTTCPIETPNVYNQQCYTNCPSEAPYSFNKVCYAICPTEAANRYNGQCYASCPTIAPYLYNQTCSSTCPSEASYSYNQSCYVACPALAPYSFNHKCYATCPTEAPIATNNECSTGCTSQAPYFYNQQCYAVCPTEASYVFNQNCYSTCPTEARYSYNQRCYVSCPATVPLHNSNSECIAACPAELPYSYNKTCYSSCPTEAPNSYNQACYTNCPGTASYLFNKTCYAACPSQANYSYNKVCQEVCPVEASYSFNHECSSACPSQASYSYNKTCYTTCPPEAALSYNKQCYTSCPNEAPNLYNQLCYTTCPNEARYSYNGNCSTSCPVNAPLYNTNNECISGCPADVPYSYNQTCYASCPTEAPNLYNQVCYISCPAQASYSLNHLCYTSCPTQAPYSFNKACIATCPVQAPKVYNNQCYSSCPANAPNVYNQQCYSSCPSQAPYLYNLGCYTSCPAEAPNSYNQVCYATCPAQAPVPQNNECSTNCPAQTPYSYNMGCYATCPAEAPSLYNNQCYATCPSAAPNQYQHQCYNNCPNEAPFLSNKTCYIACPAFAPTVFNQSCYTSCPNQAPFSYNHSCLATCPSEASYSVNNSCSTSCPTEAPYSNNKVCYSACPNSAPYLFNQTCHTICPSQAPNVYNKECLSDCPSEAPKSCEGVCSTECPSEDPIITVITSQNTATTVLMQLLSLANSNNPNLIFTTGFSSMIFFIKYMDITIPTKVQAMLIAQGSGLVSAGFGTEAPDSLKTSLSDRVLAEVIQEDDWTQSGLYNLWDPLLSLLIILVVTFIIIISEYSTRKYQTANTLFKVLLKIAKWNLPLLVLCGNFSHIMFYSLIEFKSVSFDSTRSIVSFVVCLVMFILSLLIVAKIIRIIINIKKSRYSLAVKKNWEDYSVLYMEFKDKSYWTLAFLPIFFFRLFIVNIIITTTAASPLFQTIFFIILSALMLIYMAWKRPLKSKLIFCHLVLNEALVFALNICLLVLAFLDAKGITSMTDRIDVGDVIVVLNAIFSTCNLFFIIILVIRWTVILYRRVKAARELGITSFAKTIGFIFLSKSEIEAQKRKRSESYTANSATLNTLNINKADTVESSRVNFLSAHLQTSPGLPRNESSLCEEISITKHTDEARAYLRRLKASSSGSILSIKPVYAEPINIVSKPSLIDLQNGERIVRLRTRIDEIHKEESRFIEHDKTLVDLVDDLRSVWEIGDNNKESQLKRKPTFKIESSISSPKKKRQEVPDDSAEVTISFTDVKLGPFEEMNVINVTRTRTESREENLGQMSPKKVR